MRKVLFVILTAVLFSLPLQIVSSQSEKAESPGKPPENKKTPDFSDLKKNSKIPEDAEIDESGFFSAGALRSDLRVADVVVHVDVKNRQLTDSIGEGDCEKDQGTGYCSYRLTAGVIEVFKGKEIGKTIEFYTGPDMSYPKEYLMGEKLLFLVWGEEDKDKKRYLGSIENSTRPMQYNVLEQMRKVLDPNAPIDETDETNPYSLKHIAQNFQEADAVVYVNVKSFRQIAPNGGDQFALRADVKTVFKGDFKPGQAFEYEDDLLHRPMREEDLGEQILYLQKRVENGRTRYEKIDYTEGSIRHGILEKLRKIAKESSNKKK